MCTSTSFDKTMTTPLNPQPLFSRLERAGTIARVSPAAVQWRSSSYDARGFSVSIYPHAVDLQPEDPHDLWPVPAVVLTVRAAGGHALRLGFSGREVRALIAALTDAGQQSLDRINDHLGFPREPFETVLAATQGAQA